MILFKRTDEYGEFYRTRRWTLSKRWTVQTSLGAIHYFRIPREQWYRSLYNLKALGFNTVETYTAWNLHEPKEGVFDFSDRLDLKAFIELAQRLGLYVIVRRHHTSVRNGNLAAYQLGSWRKKMSGYALMILFSYRLSSVITKSFFRSWRHCRSRMVVRSSWCRSRMNTAHTARTKLIYARSKLWWKNTVLMWHCLPPMGLGKQRYVPGVC